MTARRGILFVVARLGAVELGSFPLLAAIARQHKWKTAFIEYRPDPRKAHEKARAFAPDVVAYSVCSTDAGEYIEINQALRKQIPFFALFGGPHPTFIPSYIQEDGVDALCRGEGDLVFPQFLDRFGETAMFDTPNFSFRLADGSIRENPLTELLDNLDTLPFPARDLLYSHNSFMARNPAKGFFAGRGCPYACSYCFNKRYNDMYRGKGRILRTKSVSYLIREIQGVAAEYPLSFVRFYDDIFGCDLDWLREFAERFPKEIGLPFCCSTRPNLVTEEYAILLKRAGCYSSYIGIECGNENLRNDFLLRRLSDAQIFEACKRIKKHGIHFCTLNMLGLPGETEEDMLETVRMNNRIGPDLADATIFQPYPGTRSYEFCLEKGYLKPGTVRFESYLQDSILDIDPALRQRICVLHRIFSIFAAHPGLLPARHLLNKTTRLNGLLSLIGRLNYGYRLHKFMYGSSLPFHVLVHGALRLLLSRNRV